MKTLMIVIALTVLPGVVLAQACGVPDAETLGSCPVGQIWDKTEGACVDALVSSPTARLC